MIPAKDFFRLSDIEKKFKRSEPLNAEDMRVYLKHGLLEPKKCGCGCGEPLEPRVDGERHQIKGLGEVNTGCYFDSLGNEFEEHPIIPHGIRRRASSPID